MAICSKIYTIDHLTHIFDITQQLGQNHCPLDIIIQLIGYYSRMASAVLTNEHTEAHNVYIEFLQFANNNRGNLNHIMPLN
jgi:hypothetical protein